MASLADCQHGIADPAKDLCTSVAAMGQTVRPTHRALQDLGLSFPPLETPLGAVDHPLVRKAQDVPAEVDAGGAERIRAATDRVWFKVKTGDYRGAAGRVACPPDSDLPEDSWWLVAAGVRQQDTPRKDFYSRLEAECSRAGADAGAGGPRSDHLLPDDVDLKRWRVELVTLAVKRMQQLVRDAVRRSAVDGKLWEVSVKGHSIGALVRCEQSESYLAISADGFYDPRLVAILLNSVPGVATDDWLVEPGEVLGITPAKGQIVYSAMLPPTALAELLELAEEPGGAEATPQTER